MRPRGKIPEIRVERMSCVVIIHQKGERRSVETAAAARQAPAAATGATGAATGPLTATARDDDATSAGETLPGVGVTTAAVAVATAAALLAGGASSDGASFGGASVSASRSPHRYLGRSARRAVLRRLVGRPRQGGGGGGGLATAVLPDGTPDMLMRRVDRLPRDVQVRIGRYLFFIAMSERAQGRLIDEAVMLHAALDDLEDKAREESEFERDEQEVRFGIDMEREIEIERADEEIHAEIAWDAAHMHDY